MFGGGVTEVALPRAPLCTCLPHRRLCKLFANLWLFTGLGLNAADSQRYAIVVHATVEGVRGMFSHTLDGRMGPDPLGRQRLAKSICWAVAPKLNVIDASVVVLL